MNVSSGYEGEDGVSRRLPEEAMRAGPKGKVGVSNLGVR